ncbi:NADH kinase pos5 [Vermiconidia calcicola]|uniref:NADH kinase pos5 n=1 Tax=Vermiconidia calcicola TaxID=1690605 RepID=A0ACC3NHR4_9PEZI|nr:NADH kinase pos5 [Vermiconidia calcicola]
MTRAWRCVHSIKPTIAPARSFHNSARRLEIRHVAELPPRLPPQFKETSTDDLLALRWPSPPRNILLVRKDNDAEARDALTEFAHHIHSTYPDVSIVLEPDVAKESHSDLLFPVYAPSGAEDQHNLYQEKVDLTSTLGGDGTVLHAASLFATAPSVPPILSFSMGTLGFLGEWKFHEYKRAFRQVYVSGAPSPLAENTNDTNNPSTADSLQAWSNVKGKSLGQSRCSRILMRNRLRIGIFDSNGQPLPHEAPFAHTADQCEDIFALNEVLLHRGANPHLANITILIGAPPHQRTLTTAIADGFLVSTPTGSTAYSLSSGGSIVHPLVSSLLLTPICPRSLSFRPLVLPANTPVTLRIEADNRGKEIEVSVDGVRRQQGLGAGMEVRVVGEEVTTGESGKRQWTGGVPSIVRSGVGGGDGEDHWVGGLNSLLKFNYPFGDRG